uniref:Small EDRK-rich factor-like N-terminal domain-containing protein n=1 Tax=Strigamia maritima TaxID=126957 RepID=T1JDM8_STRMM
MARGQQKLQSQQKNAKKQAELKKQSSHDQKAAAQKALTFVCVICKSQMPDPKTYKQHFENKHSKSPLPVELEDVVFIMKIQLEEQRIIFRNKNFGFGVFNFYMGYLHGWYVVTG